MVGKLSYANYCTTEQKLQMIQAERLKQLVDSNILQEQKHSSSSDKLAPGMQNAEKHSSSSDKPAGIL
jgi:hypothetical protein